jgi:hypothetical protein
MAHHTITWPRIRAEARAGGAKVPACLNASDDIGDGQHTTSPSRLATTTGRPGEPKSHRRAGASRTGVDNVDRIANHQSVGAIKACSICSSAHSSGSPIQLELRPASRPSSTALTFAHHHLSRPVIHPRARCQSSIESASPSRHLDISPPSSIVFVHPRPALPCSGGA